MQKERTGASEPNWKVGNTGEELTAALTHKCTSAFQRDFFPVYMMIVPPCHTDVTLYLAMTRVRETKIHNISELSRRSGVREQSESNHLLLTPCSQRAQEAGSRQERSKLCQCMGDKPQVYIGWSFLAHTPNCNLASL